MSTGCLRLDFRNTESLTELLRSDNGRYSKIKKLKFFAWFIPTETVERILGIIEEKERIDCLELRGRPLWRLNKDLVASSFSKIREIKISQGAFTTEQFEALFRKILDGDSTLLKELYVCDMTLRYVDELQLSRAVGTMKRVTLRKCKLRIDTIRLLLQELRISKTLIYLDLSGNKEFETGRHDLNFPGKTFIYE